MESTNNYSIHLNVSYLHLEVFVVCRELEANVDL